MGFVYLWGLKCIHDVVHTKKALLMLLSFKQFSVFFDEEVNNRNNDLQLRFSVASLRL